MYLAFSQGSSTLHAAPSRYKTMSAKDYDPRIVDFYDEDNPDGADHDYYRSLDYWRNAQ